MADLPDATSAVPVEASVYAPRRWSTGSLALSLIVQATPFVILLWVWQPALVQIAPASDLAVFDIAAPSEPEAEPEPAADQPPKEIEPAPSEATDVPSSDTPAVAASPSATPAPIVPLPMAPAAPAAAFSPPQPRPKPPAKGEQSADWHARVLGRLNVVKAYPASARARRQQGVVLIRFTLDRRGNVLKAALAESAGFALLDREAMALPARAAPLPAPPDDVPGQEIELVVPVEFHF